MAEASKSLQALADAGMPIDRLGDTERAVLGSLTDDEARVLAGIYGRLSSDVSGFALPPVSIRRLADDHGGLFF